MTDPSSAAVAAAVAEFATLRDFLRWGVSRFNAAGIAYGQGAGNALDEAAFLILETLNLPIDDINPFLDARLTTDERRRLAEIIEARAVRRVPAAYLTGHAYIQDIRFNVDERVLVPRSFIGELLAGDMDPLAGVPPFDDPDTVGAVLDLCTGSGCLAVLAALRFPQAAVDATDLSADALQVAQSNVAAAGLGDRIELHEGDLFAPLAGRRYDIVIANPPYVDAEAMAALPQEFRHEPALALDGGTDGLDIVRRILAAAPAHLNPGGGLLCEIGTGRERLEADYPEAPFLWLETEESSGEVFWLAAEDFTALAPAGRR